MTKRLVELSPLAELDMVEIGDFISLDNPVRAVSFLEELRAFMAKLAISPFIGRSRDDLRKGLRSIPFVGYPYVMYYRVLPRRRGIRVERVLHGARDISRIF